MYLERARNRRFLLLLLVLVASLGLKLKIFFFYENCMGVSVHLATVDPMMLHILKCNYCEGFMTLKIFVIMGMTEAQYLLLSNFLQFCHFKLHYLHGGLSKNTVGSIKTQRFEIY